MFRIAKCFRIKIKNGVGKQHRSLSVLPTNVISIKPNNIFPSNCYIHSNATGKNFKDMFYSNKCEQFDIPSLPMNKDVINSELTLFSGGKVFGHLTDSSVVCRYGNTTIHVAVSSKEPKEKPTSAFFPLTVDYRNRLYGHGVIPHSGSKRERPQEEDILIARIIDRAVRPLFPKGYVNDVQLTITAHSLDASGTGDPVVASILAASYALRTSSQPWYLLDSATSDLESTATNASDCGVPMGPSTHGVIGCVRLGLINNEFIINPTVQQLRESEMNLLYSGTHSRPMMIEFEGSEIPEDTLKKAMFVAQAALRPTIDYQYSLLSANGGIKAKDSSNKKIYTVPSSVQSQITSHGFEDAKAVFHNEEGVITTKEERGKAEGKYRSGMMDWIRKSIEENSECVDILDVVTRGLAIDTVMNSAFRSVTLHNTYRADGRVATDIRPIESVVDVLPAPVHGSSVFRRGDTHVLCAATLGSKDDNKVSVPIHPIWSDEIDPHTPSGAGITAHSDSAIGSMGGLGLNTGTVALNRKQQEVKERFMLHYDFPPYCTGDVGSAASLNRRMVGHGFLAEKAIKGVLPPFHSFPYTIRLHAECTSSSGSSSMASVVGGTLALLDAGVPLTNLVAGISIGLITDDAFKVHPPVDSNTPLSNSNVLETPINGKYKLLTDIIGSEDYHGDMDFKIAGSNKGVTAMQLDVKLQYGIPINILNEALDQAATGRGDILAHMTDVLENRRGTSVSPVGDADVKPLTHSIVINDTDMTSNPGAGDTPSYTPTSYISNVKGIKSHTPRARMIKFTNLDKKKNVVGEHGDMRRFIEETYNVTLDTSEEGYIYIYGHEQQLTNDGIVTVSNNVQEAYLLVKDLVTDVAEGEVFENAEITEVRDFGVMLKLTRSQDAILHISELTHNKKVLDNTTYLSDILRVGQTIPVVVINVDKAVGLVKVSRKQLLNSTDAELDTIETIQTSGNIAPTGTVGVGFSESSVGEISAGDSTAPFPVHPPMKYNATFFQTQVVSKEDVAIAMEKQRNGISPLVEEKSKKSNSKSKPKSKKSNSKEQQNSNNNSGNSVTDTLSNSQHTAKREYSTVRSVNKTNMEPWSNSMLNTRYQSGITFQDRIRDEAPALRVPNDADIDEDARYARINLTTASLLSDDHESRHQKGDLEMPSMQFDDLNVRTIVSKDSPYHVQVKYKTTPTGYDDSEFQKGPYAPVEADLSRHQNEEWTLNYSSKSVLLKDMEIVDKYLSNLELPEESGHESKSATSITSNTNNSVDNNNQSKPGIIKYLMDLFSQSADDVLKEEELLSSTAPGDAYVPNKIHPSASIENSNANYAHFEEEAEGESVEPEDMMSLYDLLDNLQQQRLNLMHEKEEHYNREMGNKSSTAYGIGSMTFNNQSTTDQSILNNHVYSSSEQFKTELLSMFRSFDMVVDVEERS